ncbi:hypothetical protein [Methanogenium organophilum]|uniref:Uncharacterized protein n=1 Tax=Methanogenium organophilum TaxID=2199 RepID=A0A9X9T7U9_METOG|nr:hypothetical protein [Methanogenium organophilum]WAI01075.1 hypothetical protein OU421_11735 [Methanogenium organophilum]
MKIDYIIKEEMWRSVAVYFVSFLVIGILVVKGYLPLPLSSIFLLALVPTATHFLLMVWYRRKEHLADPTITNILRHALQLEGHGEKDTKQRRAVIEKVVDAVLVVAVFLIYLYASLVSSVNQIFWFLALVIIGILLTRIIFIERGKYRVNLVRWVVFYFIVSAIILLRYLILEYPVIPILGGLILVGIVSIVVLLMWEKRFARNEMD